MQAEFNKKEIAPDRAVSDVAVEGNPGTPGFDYRMTSEEIAALPMVRFPRTPQLINTPERADEVLAALADRQVLGFDTETRPAFHRGQNYLPAILQLCDGREAFVLMLRKTGMTPALLGLLSDPRVIKACVAPGQDVHKLQELSQFDGHGFVDLSDMSRDLGVQNHGLRGLTAVLLGKRISKRAQVSNWEKDPLDEQQVVYAATDAWLSYELFVKMKKEFKVSPRPIDYPFVRPEDERPRRGRRSGSRDAQQVPNEPAT